jgi:acyl-CoA synthetase (AMP-forming)/AMP-acid ligase II
MNTTDYLLQHAEDSQIALIAKNGQTTYQELREGVARLAGALHAAGIRATDRVGVLGENSFFWVAAYLAILKIGAVAVPFPTVSTAEDLKRKERFVNCQAVCVDRRAYGKFSAAFREGMCLISDEALAPGAQPLSSNGAGREKPAEVDERQDAALMLTSGTTAYPRAVRVTHRNIQANTESIIQYLDLNSRDRILVVLPFFYCFGTSLLHTHLRVGGTLVLCNTFAYPETALDMMEATRCTGLAGVPSTYQTLLRNTTFVQRQLDALRKIQQAGGKLQNVFIQELVKQFPQAKIFVMYGQTEATARLSYLPPELLPAKIGSIGKGIPGVTLRVLDESGKEVKPGEVGEIYAWGDNISPGYLNDPAANAEKYVDGALRTGDLATVDEDGYIYIVDRKADFIKSMGHRVSSQEIEARVLEIDEVVSAAAIGVPDEIQGEAIKVFVTLKSGATITSEKMIAVCRQHMARHMVPNEIVIVKSLPMNAHGKVVKSALRSLADQNVG